MKKSSEQTANIDIGRKKETEIYNIAVQEFSSSFMFCGLGGGGLEGFKLIRFRSVLDQAGYT